MTLESSEEDSSSATSSFELASFELAGLVTGWTESFLAVVFPLTKSSFEESLLIGEVLWISTAAMLRTQTCFTWVDCKDNNVVLSLLYVDRASLLEMRTVQAHVNARMFQVRQETNKAAGTSFERFHEDNAECGFRHGPT